MTSEGLAIIIKASEYRLRAQEYVMKELEKISDKHKLSGLYTDPGAIAEQIKAQVTYRQQKEGLNFSYDVLLAELDEEEKKAPGA